MVEGIRGFIPASRLSLSYIEDLESYLLKDIEVQVIDVDQANNRLVLSAHELLKEKEKKEREEKIANIKVGSVLTGTVESPPELRCICTSGRRTFRTCTRFPDQPETYQIPKKMS